MGNAKRCPSSPQPARSSETMSMNRTHNMTRIMRSPAPARSVPRQPQGHLRYLPMTRLSNHLHRIEPQTVSAVTFSAAHHSRRHQHRRQTAKRFTASLPQGSPSAFGLQRGRVARSAELQAQFRSRATRPRPSKCAPFLPPVSATPGVAAQSSNPRQEGFADDDYSHPDRPPKGR